MPCVLLFILVLRAPVCDWHCGVLELLSFVVLDLLKLEDAVKTKLLRSPPSPNCLLLLLLVLLRPCCLIAEMKIADCWNELLMAVELLMRARDRGC